MRALLTGASSFLGQRLAQALARDGWELHLTQHHGKVPKECGGSQATIELVDEGIESWIRAVAKARPDVVVHLAASPGADATGVRKQEQFRANLETGVMLLEGMREAGCRALVHTGSYWEYGDGTDSSPTCFYAVAKRAFDGFLDHAVRTQDLRALTLVLYDVYGEQDPREKLLRLLWKAAVSGATLDLTPGEQHIDLVHVDDVVRAYLTGIRRVMAQTRAGHEVFAVRSGSTDALKARVELFIKALNRPVSIRWGGKTYRMREVMRPWEGTLLPEWRATIPVEEGFARVVAAWSTSPEAAA